MNSVAIIGTRGYPSYYGGFETLVRELAPYFAEHGWDVTVYGRNGATLNNGPAVDPRVVSKITPGVESKSLSTLSYGFTSSFHAARYRPDAAIIMNVANGYWLPMLKARGIPTIVNVDGMEWERAKWGRTAKSVFKLGAKLTAAFADRLIFDSKEIARRWEDEFSRVGDFIPYGARVEPNLPMKDRIEPGSYVLFVARFVPENTVGEFLAAAEKISQSRNVVIVGSSGYGGSLDSAAKALSDANESVHWLGHISDDARLHALWQNAGAYFHGHSVGGTNPALIQAMACGAPVVARDTVYNREVLADCAVFVNPDPGSIADAIEQVISDPGKQRLLREQSLERQRLHYTWDAVCADYLRSTERAL